MNDPIEVLILAGGRGTRLASIINDIPKPMAPIQGTPFLEILIKSIQAQGFKKFRLLVGYRAEDIQNYFGNGEKLGIEINYTTEPTPLGTGGAIKKAIQESSFKKFLIFNGDTLFEADLQRFIASSKGPFNIVLRHVEDSTRYGQVAVNEQFKVLSFIEKGPGLAGGYINAGIYFFSNQLLQFMPADAVFSIEQDVLPNLAKAGQLNAVALEGKFIDIGIPEDYQRAQTYLGQFKTPKLIK